ncbi:RNA polymerase sigma factor [Nonomuraea lactucae]|uniref:RNA polymerase sigma factor n=1 Tax=Nonomuraea lactucae TaxID=2249762 RepID=UPI001F05AA71|nr:sigma-70 family RNA polymerase sigma factor [Nonomuraea lactucae]
MYRRTYEQILGHAVRRCSSPEDATDVVAETYVIAWRRITELPDGEAGKLWLYGVARRVLANHRRSERRRLTRHTELIDEIEHLYIAPSHHSEQHGVDEAMDMLADSDRELLALTLWKGLDPGEIATMLDCSRNAARIRLHRAANASPRPWSRPAHRPPVSHHGRSSRRSQGEQRPDLQEPGASAG